MPNKGEKIQQIAQCDRQFKCCPHENKKGENTHKNFNAFVGMGSFNLVRYLVFLVSIRQANNSLKVESNGKCVKEVHTLLHNVEISWCVHCKSIMHSVHIYSSFESKFVYILFSIKLQQVIKCEPTISQTKIHIIHTKFQTELLRKRKRECEWE